MCTLQMQKLKITNNFVVIDAKFNLVLQVYTKSYNIAYFWRIYIGTVVVKIKV